uniref:GB1/RHD3-type G domain-containing protein n=2 Tax=Cuerna arida TaxID=1464854 RepID=A0A1B6EST8_9HEMI
MASRDGHSTWRPNFGRSEKSKVSEISYASHDGNYTPAIQILTTDENVIKIIKEYENGPTLDSVLCGEEHGDMLMFVFSVTGKTRGGKSFLLNLAAKYLEHQGHESWMTGKIPNVFEWKGGKDSITRGLCICPKIYKPRNLRGEKIGILLMDNQGLFDGEAEDGVSVAMSGISTAISSYQIYNIKEKIGSDNLEAIWRFLVKDSNEGEVDQSKTCLMFVIRDYIEENYGLANGQQYIEQEQNRGTSENKRMWESLLQQFPNIKCLPLPHPGIKVTKKSFEGNLNEIDEEFMSEINKFFNEIFNPKTLNAEREKQNLNFLTGSQIYNCLMTCNGTLANSNCSFLSIFTEHGNQEKLKTMETSFQSRLKMYVNNPSRIAVFMDTFLTDARPRFKGNSATEYCAKLEMFMVQKANITLQEWMVNRYEDKIRDVCIKETDTILHTILWPFMKSNLNLFVGSKEDKQASSDFVAKKAADIYYKKLSEEKVEDFKSRCMNKTIHELAGYGYQYINDNFRQNLDFTVPQCSKTIWLKYKFELQENIERILLMITVEDALWFEAKENQLFFLVEETVTVMKTYCFIIFTCASKK